MSAVATINVNFVHFTENSCFETEDERRQAMLDDFSLRNSGKLHVNLRAMTANFDNEPLVPICGVEYADLVDGGGLTVETPNGFYDYNYAD